jgi:hypothetical protein
VTTVNAVGSTQPDELDFAKTESRNPARFRDDNYISLLPGEKREVGVHIRETDVAGRRPKLLVDGFNIPLTTTQESQH